MKIENKILTVLLIISTILVPVIHGQVQEVGIYGIWTDQDIYQPGQTITVTVELGWDFPSVTQISPGIYDPLTEEYLVEDFYNVEDSGYNNVTLSFTSPDTDGVYEYEVDVYYDDDGWQMSDTGYEEYTITIQVGSVVIADYEAWVTDIEAPVQVEPGEVFNVTVRVEVSFPTLTWFNVAITEPDTGEVVNEIDDQILGDEITEYWFEVVAPENEGPYSLLVSVIFETSQGWSFTEDAAKSFEVNVIGPGKGIPGYPLSSLLLGSLIYLYRKRK